MREGKEALSYVLLEGRLRIVKDILGRQIEFAEYDFTEGDFLGEVPLLLGSPTFSFNLRPQQRGRLPRHPRLPFSKPHTLQVG